MRAIVGFLAAAMLLGSTAGCGTVRQGASSAGIRAASQTPARSHYPWPPGGSRALAHDVGRRLLARLVLPSGSHRTGPRGAPVRAEVIGSVSLVDLHRFFVLPMPMSAAVRFLRAHPPAGMEANGTGISSDRSGVTEEDVAFYLSHPPTGITSDTELLVSLAKGPRGGTRARADAQVVWYPRRSAAEYLRASAIRSARISASFMNPSERRFVKVITSRRVITRLAALLDGMRATDNSIMFCPMIDASYHVTFTARAGLRVVIDAAGCARDDVVVNGTAQPPLWDPGERLINALHRVLALSSRYR
jgi:hypothetical protein